jgi:hypothetical protein
MALLVDIQKEKTYQLAAKTAWSLVAAASAYAVIVPDALLELNSAFWGILLFISILSFPSGMATNRFCGAVWGIVLLGATISYTIYLRDYQTGGGTPLKEVDFLQVGFPVFVAAVGLLTGITRFVAWDDARIARKRALENSEGAESA